MTTCTRCNGAGGHLYPSWMKYKEGKCFRCLGTGIEPRSRRRVTVETIKYFSGEHRWLSNFHPSPVMMYGEEYPDVEHAYQAAKTLDKEEREAIWKCISPGKAKNMGRKVTLRKDWDDVKLNVMYALVERKFQDPELQKKLLATKGIHLVEGNAWGDTFWGVCKGKGMNHLGMILMKVRNVYELRKSKEE